MEREQESGKEKQSRKRRRQGSNRKTKKWKTNRKQEKIRRRDTLKTKRYNPCPLLFGSSSL